MSGAITVHATSAVTLKPQLGGALDRYAVPVQSLRSVVNGSVIDVHWADLQLTRGGALVQNNAIDQDLAAIRSINASQPSHPLHLKLRVFGGIWAPDWAKTMDGAAIPIYASKTATTPAGTIGRFWLADYGAAYADLMSKLAAKYDSAPEIEEVTVSRCTTIYDEPFMRQSSDPRNVTALLAAGFTTAQDEACIQQQIDETAAAWTTTRFSLALDFYQQINSDGTTTTNMTFTQSMMSYCRQTYSTGCVLENNDISAVLATNPGKLFVDMQNAGPPLSFQTLPIPQCGDLSTTLQWAVNVHGGSVELPSGFTTVMSNGQVESFGAELQANALQ